MQELIITNEEFYELYEVKDFNKSNQEMLIKFPYGEERWVECWNCEENGKIKGTAENYTLLKWHNEE